MTELSVTNLSLAETVTDHTARCFEVLREVFGYDNFRSQQQATIESVCQGHDALVIMPTGGGKSLCFQIPAQVLPGVAIVISPLIALMQDQVAALHQAGVRTAFLNSTLTGHEQAEVLHSAAAGDLDLLYVAPERLLKEDTLSHLKQSPINLIAIDEAHCVSSWGHDFRQDYLALGQLAEAFPGVPRIALTATADERTRADIVARLALDAPKIFIDGFDRPNIHYAVQIKRDAKAQLLSFLHQHKDESGIVYCLSRKSVESTAEWLHLQGFTALPYHAGMDAAQRQTHQQRFLKEERIIIVATIAFGMGIDKPDVRFVAHLDLPKSMEAYYQETGRAGRDGQPAEAWMVYGMQDVVRMGRMLDESNAGEDHKRIERSKLDALLGWCELTSCRRRELLAYFGESQAEDCGHCDNCNSPPVTWDATQSAQKALSCVYRTEQRFGASHIVDVLRGSQNEKVKRFGHDQVSTFGIGTEHSDQQWRSIFRQLIVRGYLHVDHNRYGALTLTAQSKPLLKGDVALFLREDPQKASVKKARSTYTLELEDEDLMEELKALRADLAQAADVPPYVIFHDATLLGMIETRPTNNAELLSINGVGQVKVSKYGEAFLALIAAH